MSDAPIAAPSVIELEKQYLFQNYARFPLTLTRGRGCYVYDTSGKRYLDLMSAYSAVSFGHAHPRIVAALVTQAKALAVTSRAFHNDRLPALLERLAHMTDLVLGYLRHGPPPARRAR